VANHEVYVAATKTGGSMLQQRPYRLLPEKKSYEPGDKRLPIAHAFKEADVW